VGMVQALTPPWELVLPSLLAERLFAHLFPGDRDEHGAVIAAGVARSGRGTRLLARELFLAQDGVDYVPGQRGYRMLRAEFVRDRVLYCRDQGLAYLAVHNHGGDDDVDFSTDDLASHERGYPALLDILKNQPVGGLVFARNAIAGDIWLPGQHRVALERARLLGRSIRRLYSSPQPRPRGKDTTYDRQARLFGDAGQDLLSRTKVGVIGAGGVGSLLVEYLARVGVGWIVVVDPDQLDVTNLPRVVGSTGLDARIWLTDVSRPEWLRNLGRRLATTKVAIARRVARTANRRVRIDAVLGNITEDSRALLLTDCDYLFLAADPHQARLVFNALVHQYLIPGVQVGAKVPVDKNTGAVGDVFAVSRPVTPSAGCLWCNGLILPNKLQEEAATPAERVVQRYVDEPDVAAPSVITLNATAASQAANEFLFALTGLVESDARIDYVRFRPRRREVWWDRPRRDIACRECGVSSESRFARGDGVLLPTRTGRRSG
jgi:hypothetical protein